MSSELHVADPKWVIYGLKLENEDQYRYVGYTTLGAAKRFEHHIDEAQRVANNYARHRWIRKHPTDVEIRVIEVCPEDDLTFLGEREVHWIAHYKTLYDESGQKPLLNHTPGGEGNKGYKFTPEQREYQKSTWTPERKEKNSKRVSEDWSEERKEALRKRNSEWSKEARSAAWTDELRAAASKRISERNHTRYHTNRSIIKPECVFCVSTEKE